jgi:signal transduction histidine kinase
MAEEVDDAEERVLTVSTRLARERLEVTIGDTGAGISSEDMERVFEPLFSTKSFGVGLGLTIVRQSIEAHGGGVELSSGQGRGTQVRLWLPLQVAAQRAVS